ncbi:EamA family transporter [Tengunoibacter tsumagoiensis]|uniref:Multidrug transporter n=1 Tax=Tengunoibacter tsumagoiensis TaxID=2014871 RepID=A0A402A5P1_9CHLR|nr:DMT family transporter [Tengunoibacter tsumagoiensis]GCE14422.1 multidrug transporter [Tengunoibacter tsumagoiensis]
MNKLTASLLVLLAGASFGILSTMVKLAYGQGFSVADVTSSQLVFGCLGLWIISLPRLGGLRHLSWQTVLKLLVSGIFPGLTGVFYYLSLQTLSASLAVILLFQFVWMSILLDWFIRRKPLTQNQWIALICVVAGTVLAGGYEALTKGSFDLVGISFALLAACSYTGNISVSGRVAVEVPASLRSTLMMTGATLITICIFPPTFIATGALEQGLWVWMVLLGIFGVIIPPFLFTLGIPPIGPAMAAILSSIELPVATTLSALVLSEKVTLSQWGGVMLILIGIFISEQRLQLRKRLRRRLV